MAQKTTTKKSLIEVFGYSPGDYSDTARQFWKLEACPFSGNKCTKFNHDKSICYGTCTVSNGGDNIVVCPIRLYEKQYATLKTVAADAFGGKVPVLMFDQYLKVMEQNPECVVALGQNSGREIRLGRQLSMDWVLAHVKHGQLQQYIGVEVQSIDITGNYRDAWHAYKHMQTSNIPSSGHGLNWANVHKRLIPQLIRKGLVYSRSPLAKKGLYFIVPDSVFRKFEDVIGADIPTVKKAANDVISVFTFDLGPIMPSGERRSLLQKRVIRFTLDEFSNRFVSGPNLPSGNELDQAIKKMLGL